VTSNYIIIVATEEENVYNRARSTQYWLINCHYYHDSDHFMDEILCEHNPDWSKICVDKKYIFTEL